MTQANAIRGRINAWFLLTLDRYMHEKYAGIKTSLLQNMPETMVELGSGTGANMRYIPVGKKLIAIEPNIHMHAALKKKAKQHQVELDLRGLRGESLDLESNSVDFVFCSLVLCSVDDPKQVISEVRRVLKPGGRFVCLEHIEAPPTSPVRSVQKFLRAPWRWFFEGCDLCRDTAHVLESAGFSSTEVEKFSLPTMFVPIKHQLTAVCVK